MWGKKTPEAPLRQQLADARDSVTRQLAIMSAPHTDLHSGDHAAVIAELQAELAQIEQALVELDGQPEPVADEHQAAHGFIASSDVSLYYEELGDGEPVVFVHELASDLRQWRGQMRSLSDRYHCLAYNARGYPPSDVPPSDADYHFEQFANDIGAVLDFLEVEAAWLVGWSMGAYASLVYAMYRPESVLGVIASGVGSGSPSGDIEAWRAEMRELAQLYETEGAEAGAARFAASANRQPMRRDHPEAFDEWLADLKSHDPAGMAKVCRNYQGLRPSLFEFEDRLKAMKPPVLLIVGDEDAACLETTRELARIIPNARLEVLPDVGHAPNLEDPERFEALVRSFLQEA